MESSASAHLNRAMYQKMRYPEEWHRQPQELTAEIGVGRVLATQLLAQDLAKEQAHSVRYDDSTFLFSLNTTDNMIYDEGEGGIEEYMTCRVANSRPGKQDMTVRFRRNTDYNVSDIDEYSFTWLKTGDLRAWRGQYKLTSLESESTEDWNTIETITDDMVDELHDRMRFHSLRRRMAKHAIDRELNRDILAGISPVSVFTAARGSHERTI